MKKVLWIVGILVVLLGGGVWAYRALASNRTASAADLQTAVVQRGSLTASLAAAGTVRTGQSADLLWQASGKVGTVNVHLGDQVQAGQELAALDPTSLPPSLLNAKQTLVNARQALDDLMNSKLQQAQAQQAVDDAQKALDDLQGSQAETLGQAQVALATAQQALKDAQTKRTAMDYPHSTNPLVIQNAQTDYLLAKLAYKDALQTFNALAHKKLTDPERVQALKTLLADQQKMDKALATYNWYLLKPSPLDIAQADANLALAQANLQSAQATYDQLKNGQYSAAVAIAEAKLADAQRAWDQVKNGPSADTVAAAQAAVDAAQATLDQAYLTAPFTGTVTELDFNPGDLVSSGKTALRLDNLASLYVDVEVSEVDVNNLKLGQTATLTFDAVPGKEYSGQVISVGTVGTVSQGVVNYTATLQIQDPDSAVKPGMTAAVSIVIAQRDNVLIAPNQAIRVNGGQRSVVILYEGQQITVPVSVGLTNDTESEITGNQVREGDTLVLNTSSVPQTGNSGRNPGIGGGFGGGFLR